MLNQLTINELFEILDCDDLDELTTIFEPFKYKKLISYQKKLFKIKDTNNLNPSLLSAMDDASTPVYVLWGLTGIIGTGVAATAISMVSLGLIPIIGGVYTYYAYKKHQDKISDWTSTFQLSYLKLEAANKIMTSLGAHPMKNSKNQFIKAVNLGVRHYKKTANVSAVSSLGVSFTSGLTLFGCFYLGISSIIESMGFAAIASLLSGPIGVGVAIGVSLLLGLYIGYKHYQSEKNSQAINSCQKMISSKINRKKIECHRLKTLSEVHAVSSIKHSQDQFVFFRKSKSHVSRTHALSNDTSDQKPQCAF